ncbi:MAG: hypothetical protein WC679_01425 [Bacteroidales bacterium]|jgi:hypothetical protein
MTTKLKIIDGKYVVSSVNLVGDTIVHIEAWGSKWGSGRQFFSIEPKTEEAKNWFENNGYPNVRKDFLIHFDIKDDVEFIKILKKAAKELKG